MRISTIFGLNARILVANLSFTKLADENGQDAILRCPVRWSGAGVSEDLNCYRCGESLATLSLPLSRRDQCPQCSADLHVCKMCRHFDSRITRQCREDGAEDVSEKERPNFCDWFVPNGDAFDPNRKSETDAAMGALDALCGGSNEN